jgi:glutathione-regulated potassium-efflux system ancillary protein KefG
MPLRILVLYAHPSHQASRANRALRAAIEDLPGVAVHDLYETYADFYVDARREKALLEESDVLLFQHPFYWYSCPALLKEWLDIVLEEGWAYGEGGEALRGKHWMHAISAAGSAGRYQRSGLNNFTIAELLRPFEQSAHFCGMRWLPPFVTHHATELDDAAIAAQAAAYRTLVERMAAGNLPEARWTFET